MDSSQQNVPDSLTAASKEIELVLEKYNICGFYTLANEHKGIQRFSFRSYSAMEWEVADNGRMIGTKINLKMDQHNISDTCQTVIDCHAISGYFAKVLSKQAEHIQQVHDDLTTAFNLDREELNHCSSPENIH